MFLQPPVGHSGANLLGLWEFFQLILDSVWGSIIMTFHKCVDEPP